MIQVTLTKLQHEAIVGILELLEIRKNENSINKQTNINAYSISNHIGRSYKGLKKSLTNLKERI